MLIEVFQDAVMITSFVFLMMLVIEYVNVLTAGKWRQSLARRKLGQYLVGALLGVLPGCLGAFTVVSLYAHGIVTIGALVTTMIATSGDEAFVMFALFPGKALLLTAILFVLGIVVGWIVDKLLHKRTTRRALGCDGFELHEEVIGEVVWVKDVIGQWKHCSLARGVLAAGLLLFLFALLTGHIGPDELNWVRLTLLFVGVASLFIVATVSDHFLEEHLWEHVAKRHLPKIFLWTFGALIVLELLMQHANFESWIQQDRVAVLLAACLVGLIPMSGPHLIFVTMFAQGVIPFSVLLASSVVQDGHGMLPMLAHSRRGFIVVKAINFIVGFIVGLVGYFGGW
ncbi:arsenic efflux protein [bacterium]|nr:arsenic efflux protein [bacterium]